MNGALLIPSPPALSSEDEAALTELYVRGTPANTLRAYERDLIYITAWKRAAFAADLAWPETQAVALRFVLDHSRDLSRRARRRPGPPRRRGADRPRPAAQPRLPGPGHARPPHRVLACVPPHEEPRLAVRGAAGRPGPRQGPPRQRRQSRPEIRAPDHPRRARGAARRHRPPELRGLRDRAMLMIGFASGGRRRSEITGLDRDDIDLESFDADGVVRLRARRHQDHPQGKDAACWC